MGSRPALLAAYVFSAVAVVAAAVGSLLIMERATVTLSVPTSTIVANRTITGGPSGRDLTTTRITASVTDTEQVTTGTVVTPATFATGDVEFTCGPCPSSGIPEGTVVATAAGIRYQTLLRGPIASSPGSVSVLVRALVAGKAGNTAANTVTVIDPPIPNVKVQNSKPITGGADAIVAQVIQQSDLDTTRAELSNKVAMDLNASLTAQAGGLDFSPDGQPTLVVTSDHKVGDHVPTFSMTIVGTLGAVVFSESQADILMRAALNQKIPRGFQLTPDLVQTNYVVQHSGANGDVTIKGSATGVIVPSVTAGELVSKIRGMRVDAARRQLEGVAPGTTVEISVKPAIPWLPVLRDHISLTIQIQSAAE